MTEGTAPLPFFASDNPPDVTASLFNFTIVAYVQTPALIERENESQAAIENRKVDDDSYRRSVSPTSWHRFTTLGFQATNGKDFDMIWRDRNSNPLCFHRLVWYNYKSYVDRECNVNPKLHAWATNVSHPFLLEHSPESLEMDTERFSWSRILAHFAKHLDKGLWKAVRGMNKRNEKTSTAQSPTKHSDNDELDNQGKSARFNIPVPVVTDDGNSDPLNSGIEELPTLMTTMANQEVEVDTSSESDAKQSAFTLSNEVRTNDGSHRISFKWKLAQKEFTELVDNKTRLHSEIFSILGVVFQETDGYFYLWDSDELIYPKRVHELTVSDLKDYLEPQITTAQSLYLVAFAVRFAFTENPISWRNSTHVQSAMKLNNLQIHESNVNTTAGIPVVAGYILLKHPTMTLRHKYTQFLRSRLVETLPYFDIRLHRKTPTDKSIAHLVVYCGENQVTDLCQELSTILNGQNTAVFLPRYTFANMTKDQIDNHFHMHETYIRALQPISLAPLVTTLDLKRVEYFSDGTTIERSTREWVLSLRREDGDTLAQCDAVNGVKNVRTAYVMAPAAYASEIREMVAKYKERLRPIARREAKYREGIPDLPDVIHITSTVQTNLDFMAKMSSSDIWSKAPPSVKSPPSAVALLILQATGTVSFRML
ncbi:hypothetical protein MHU86_19443 [Fragilaria crotonensis]|nr:hypothetical protein MHU86_19443 [Fragilaria crotonensis]